METSAELQAKNDAPRQQHHVKNDCDVSFHQKTHPFFTRIGGQKKENFRRRAVDHRTVLFQIGTTRFISSIRNWQAAKASPRCGATTSTQSDGSLTFTTPTRCTNRTDSMGQRSSIWRKISSNWRSTIC